MCERKSIGNGIISGVFAAILFALFILLCGMTEMMGNIVGLSDKLFALLTHFMINILAGVVFVCCLGKYVHSWISGLLFGALFSLIMWLLSSLTYFGHPNGSKIIYISLIAYLIYGISLGLSYCFLKKGKLHKLKHIKAG